MATRKVPQDAGMGIGLLVSTVTHLAVFLLLYWWGGQHISLPIQETYYVDVVNLPVADPRSGSPVQQGDSQPAPSPAADPPPQVLPAPRADKASPPKAPVRKDTDELQERIEKLKRADEARQQEAALARLKARIRTQGSGRAGMPGKQGSEAGSDYSAYLKSRLEDALEKTASYSSRSPEVVVRLFVDGDGRLSRRKTERSSGDRAFEISVLRAIELASEKFPPPPGRSAYEGVFVFRPKGITAAQ